MWPVYKKEDWSHETCKMAPPLIKLLISKGPENANKSKYGRRSVEINNSTNYCTVKDRLSAG